MHLISFVECIIFLLEVHTERRYQALHSFIALSSPPPLLPLLIRYIALYTYIQGGGKFFLPLVIIPYRPPSHPQPSPPPVVVKGGGGESGLFVRFP